MSNKNFIKSLVFIVLICCLCFCAHAADLPDQMVLSWGVDASNSCSIRFRMPIGQTTTQVQYIDKNAYQQDFEHAHNISLEGVALEPGYVSFHATIDNLTPATQYYYRVGSESTWGQPQTFTTAPLSKDFTFLYLGDPQADPDAPLDTAYQAWGTLLQNAANAQQPQFILLGGDLVNDGNSAAEWNAFLTQASPVASSIPLMPAMGNHDNTGLYTKIFALPQNGPQDKNEAFYSFDYQNAHIVVMDSNAMGAEDTTDIQAWLNADLSSSDKTWNIVMFHHPVYTTNENPKDAIRAQKIKQNIVPIMEQYGVDLVLNGHQHVYMRTHPMKQQAIAPDGIVYLMGVSGPKGNYALGNYEYIAKAFNDSSLYTAVHVQGDVLTLTTKDDRGNTVDTYEIAKKSPAQQIRFDDVSGWAQEHVAYLANRNLINGVGDHLFAPDKQITRAEFVTILFRMSGDTTAANQLYFTDVSLKDWYANSVTWAYQHGIVEGTDSMFFPDYYITRQDMAVMMQRYAENIANFTFVKTTPAISFTDEAQIAQYAKSAVSALQTAGIVNGVGENLFCPLDHATRAQATKVLAMALQNIE